MAEFIQCTGCSKRFSSRPDLAGKTVKCPQCGTKIVVSLAPVAESPPSAHPALKSAATPPSDKPAKAARRPILEELTTADLNWLRMAGAVATMGALSLVLPIFGLQFRQLARLGDSASGAGILLIVIGAIIAALVFFRHSKGLVLKIGLAWMATSVVSIIGSSGESVGEVDGVWSCRGWIFGGMARAFKGQPEKAAPGQDARAAARL